MSRSYHPYAYGYAGRSGHGSYQQNPCYGTVNHFIQAPFHRFPPPLPPPPLQRPPFPPPLPPPPHNPAPAPKGAPASARAPQPTQITAPQQAPKQAAPQHAPAQAVAPQAEASSAGEPGKTSKKARRRAAKAAQEARQAAEARRVKELEAGPSRAQAQPGRGGAHQATEVGSSSKSDQVRAEARRGLEAQNELKKARRTAVTRFGEVRRIERDQREREKIRQAVEAQRELNEDERRAFKSLKAEVSDVIIVKAEPANDDVRIVNKSENADSENGVGAATRQGKAMANAIVDARLQTIHDLSEVVRDYFKAVRDVLNTN